MHNAQLENAQCTTNGLELQRKMHNFCDKREQSSLLGLQSGAKITTEGSNSQFSLLTPHFIANGSKTFGSPPSPCSLYSDWEMVEALVRGIELSGVDITGDYHQWMRIGFALASAFGEGGRGFYHRVSMFYSGYSNVECNRQYDRCLRARGGGIGLGTFIYLAKTA